MRKRAKNEDSGFLDAPCVAKESDITSYGSSSNYSTPKEMEEIGSASLEIAPNSKFRKSIACSRI